MLILSKRAAFNYKSRESVAKHCNQEETGSMLLKCDSFNKH